jgi:hypothetical protein
MTALRRSIALTLVLLALPSAWSVMTFGADRWIIELVFVACCFVAAGFAWAGVRFWQLVLFTVAALYTYVITGPLITGVVLSAPTPWTYIGAVAREAERRSFYDGAWLVWSLLVLPAAFPLICLLAAWLCIAARRNPIASAI